MAQYQNYFVGDAKDKDVVKPRETATSTDPNKQPSQAAAPSVPFTPVVVDQMQITFDDSLLQQDPTIDPAYARTKARAAYDLFCKIAKGSEGQALLKEMAGFPRNQIADFPKNIVFEWEEPPDEDVKKSMTKTMATWPGIATIKVVFVNTLPKLGDVAVHTPAGLSSEYTVSVLMEKDDPSQGTDLWPAIPTCVPNIMYSHKKAESQMVVALFHELVHIWFMHKFWMWGGQSENNLGHETYDPCQKTGRPFFTEVLRKNHDAFRGVPTQPFYSKLKTFYEEVDASERPPVKK